MAAVPGEKAAFSRITVRDDSIGAGAAAAAVPVCDAPAAGAAAVVPGAAAAAAAPADKEKPLGLPIAAHATAAAEGHIAAARPPIAADGAITFERAGLHRKPSGVDKDG